MFLLTKTVGKVTTQSSRNSRLNLSHTLECNKTKPTSNHTGTKKHTAAESVDYNRRASNLVRLKSQRTVQS